LKKRYIIAIDGPAGSGKSITARLVANKLGFLYIDSGAIYRTLTLQALREGISFDDEAALVRAVQRANIEVQSTRDRFFIFLNGEDVTEKIRAPEVSAQVSVVSENPKVRELITEKQREIARGRSVVVEGRDIGTVVFPEADLKIYMQASLKERAKRRFKELQRKDYPINIDEIENEISKRDRIDSERDASPLRKAQDAIVLDTTNLSIDEQVDFILKKIAEI
jgi:cytidylate kinase